MRPSRRAVAAEVLEARRLFAFGVAAGEAVGPFAAATAVRPAALVSIASGATIDFSTASQTVSNVSPSVLVTFFRTGDPSGEVAANYATSDGTAHAGTDYTSNVGVVTFFPGETEKSISIALADRPAAPAAQDFTVSLLSTSPGADLGATTSQTITIQNDRAPVSLAASTYSKTTDDTGVDFVVNRGGNTTIPVSVAYATSDVTTTAGLDYTDASGTLSFDPGETSKAVHVDLLSNRHAANGVQFGFALFDPLGGALLNGTSSATVTIANGYSPVQLDAASYTTTTGATALSVTVTRDGNTALAGSVDYATADGTATSGPDYVAAVGTLNFAPGETSKHFDVLITGNVEAAGDRDFTVGLAGYGGAAVAGAVTSAPVTIENPYSPLRFVAAGYSVSTDDATATLTVHRTGNTSVAATVDYATSDLTAVVGEDYDAVSGTLTFAPGDDSETIVVPLRGNADSADGLAFQVTLSGGSGGAVVDSPAQATVTIANGHVPVQLDASAYTFSTDDATATLVVTRSGDTTRAVSVDYATADGSAHDGTDYTAASGTLHFAAGETEETITVPLLHNFAAADGVVFGVALSAPAGGAELGAIDSAPVSIANLHSLVQTAQPTYVVDVRLGTVTVEVVRTGNTSFPASVDYSTIDGTAVDGEDYYGTTGTLAFGPGESSAFIELSVLGNAASPPSRRFGVVLAAPDGNAVIGGLDGAAIDIRNTQSLVQFSSAEYSASADAGTVTLTLNRAGNTLVSTTVGYATADGSALAGRDYAAASGTVSFAAGQASKTISIPVLTNPSGAPSVAFSVSLLDPTGAVIGAAGTAVVTVTNPSAVVAFDGTTLTVSNDDGVASLLVRRTGNTSLAGSVTYTTFSNTAVAGQDYAAATGVLSFGPGEVTKSVEVSLLTNALAPASRTFHVTIGGASGSSVVGDADTAVVTVTNIHSVVTFATTTYVAAEADGVVTFTLSRLGNLEHAATVGFVTADGTASAGADYAAASDTVSFEPGQATATFTVAVNSDLEFDPNETFGVSLVSPADGAVVGDGASASVTLADTTPAPTFAGGGLVATERPGRLDGVSLAFDQALAAPPAAAFTMFARSADQAGGAARLRPVAIGEVAYDPATHAVTVKPTKRLKAGVFYQLVVNADLILNEGGKKLDGAGTGQEGSVLVVNFGRGRKLRYVDQNGDTVQLSLRGPGVMELVRRADGEGERLTLSGTTTATKLLGTVRAGKLGGDGHTTLGSVAGLGAATSLLTAGQFTVDSAA
jgi:hypothetical protein